MLSNWKTNTMTRFLTLFTLILLLCLLASALLFSGLGKIDLGMSKPKINIEEAYQSEPFSFHLEGYDIFLPYGGLLASFPLSNSYRGLVFLAEGEVIRTEDRFAAKKITGGYLIVDEETYLQIKGDTLFLPLEEYALSSRILDALEELIHSPALNAFGFDRIFLPHGGRSHLYLEYNGAPLVQLDYSTENSFSLSLAFYFSLVILIALLIILLLSFDLKPSFNLADYLGARPSTPEIALGLAILIILFLVHLFGSAASPLINPFRGAVGLFFLAVYLALFLLLLFFVFKGIIPSPFPHLKWRQLPQDLGLGLIIALIITVLSGLQLSSFANFSFPPAKELLLYFIWATIFELIWRGVLQTTMERLWGLRWGLLGSVIIFTALFFVAGAIHIPDKNIFLFWETLFFLPGTALILGYAYQKRRSILGNSFLLTILFFLSRLL